MITRTGLLFAVLFCLVTGCTSEDTPGDDDDNDDDTADDDTGHEESTVYTDVDPDVEYTEWDCYVFKLDSSMPDHEGEFYVWKHPDNVQIASYDENSHVLVDGGGLPMALEEGAEIGETSGTWTSAYLAYLALNNWGAEGNWIGVTDRFLGLRFLRDGSWYYGWARLDIDEPPTHFVLKDYAYQDAPGVAIDAGAGM